MMTEAGVFCGALQGLILGPFLFLIYVSGLTNITRIYADGSTCCPIVAMLML